MAAVTVIKLTGENHNDIDRLQAKFKAICEQGGYRFEGQFLCQHAVWSFLFARHLMVKAVKPTITGNFAYTSDFLKWTSRPVRTKCPSPGYKDSNP